MLPQSVHSNQKAPSMGIEPTTTRLRVLRSTIWATKASWQILSLKMRRPGIEPGPPAWKADILPLYYRRGLWKRIICGYNGIWRTDVWICKIHPPRIELGTSRVLGERHNQLDQGCLYTSIRKYFHHQTINYMSSWSAELSLKKKYILRGLNSGPLACEASVITN